MSGRQRGRGSPGGWHRRPCTQFLVRQRGFCGDCCGEVTRKQGGRLSAVLMGFQGRKLSAAGKPERMRGATRLSLAGTSRV